MDMACVWGRYFNGMVFLTVILTDSQEVWNSPYSNGSFPLYAKDIDGGSSPSTAMLSEVARALKIHLFDIDIPGKITFIESKTLRAGETPTIVDTDVERIGIGICYDIWFQELAMIYAARGAHLVCYPGAFNMTTGPLHWELLQRASYMLRHARLLEKWALVTSPGALYLSRTPFGEVLATTEEQESIIVGAIDCSVMDTRRTSLPLAKQRQGDLYKLVDLQRLNLQDAN